MKTYVALLRGINVSGQKKIKMADLSAGIKGLGFNSVQTYIQSGNVLFKCEKVAREKLEKKIEGMIAEKFGFMVPIVIRTSEELKSLVATNPFLVSSYRDQERIYITFLKEGPSPDNIIKLKSVNCHPEEFILSGKAIYFYSPLGYAKAKMNNNFFESKLKVVATTRNWRTVLTLLEMTKQS